MKKNQTPTFSMNQMAKMVKTALNNLFFINNQREFERLKNFIAS